MEGVGEEHDTAGSLGERGVLRRVLSQFGEARAALIGPGDDAAVLRLDGDLVVTSDSMIEGPDFRLAWHTGFELGWKLAATNLSDVAAMGARPIALTVAFACPRGTPGSLLEEIARGLEAACRELAPGCGVVGGDLAQAPVLTANVTALGDMERRSPVMRSGARPGDQVAYAGDLGLAGMGLSLLFEHAVESDGTAHGRTLERLRSEAPGPLAAQLAPSPPIQLGPLSTAATSMLDVSDSLSIDAARIAEASGVTIAFSTRALEDGFSTQRGSRVPVPAMLTGGEDHGLLATFPRDVSLPEGFVAIGEVVARGATAAETGVLLDGVPYTPSGWDPYTVRLPGL